MLFLHPAGGYMCVNLCRRNGLMAQQFLNTSQIGAVVEHVRGEAVPKRMRADGGIEAGDQQIFIHLAAYAAGAQSLAVFVGEQHLAVERRIVGQAAIAKFNVVLNALHRAGTNGANTFLFAFSADVNHFAEKIDIVHIQTHQLADPHAGAVEDFHDGAVTGAQPDVGRRGVQKPLDIFESQKLGQSFFLLGGSDGRGGVARDTIAFDEKFVKAANGCQLACRGGLAIRMIVEVGHKAADGVEICGLEQGVDIDGGLRLCGDGGFLAGPGVGAGVSAAGIGHVSRRGQEGAELLKVGRIAFCGMIGEVFFKFQITDKILYHCRVVHKLHLCIEFFVPLGTKPKPFLFSFMPTDLHGVGHVFIKNFIGLMNERLGQFEAQYGRVKPVETGSGVVGRRNKGVQKQTLLAGFITKDILFRTFVQNELSFYDFHSIP